MNHKILSFERSKSLFSIATITAALTTTNIVIIIITKLILLMRIKKIQYWIWKIKIMKKEKKKII